MSVLPLFAYARSFRASAACVCNDRSSRASGAGAQFEQPAHDPLDPVFNHVRS